MTRLLVGGVTSYRNRGVAALAESTLAGASMTGDSPILVWSNSPEYDQKHSRAYGVQFSNHPYITDAGKVVRRIRSTRMRQAVQLSYSRLGSLGIPADIDAYVFLGGDMVSDTYGLGPLRTVRDVVSQFAGRSVPVLLLSQTFGPFRSAEARQLFEDIVTKASRITVRDTPSQEMLSGLPYESVEYRPDASFGLIPSVNDLKPWACFDQGRPLVAIVPSGGNVFYSGLDDDRHTRSWASAIQSLLESEPSMQVAVIAHSQDFRPAATDSEKVSAICRSLGWDERVRPVAGDYGTYELKALISKCDFVVGERMHGCFAGLSQRIPTTAVAYSPKATNVLSDMYGSELATSFVIQSKLLDDPPAFASSVRQSYEAREDARDGLVRWFDNGFGDPTSADIIAEALESQCR